MTNDLSKVRVKNILFDLDGTLADPFLSFKESLNYAFVQLQKPVASDATIRTCIGPPLHNSLVDVMGFAASEVPEIMRIYRDHHKQSFLDLYEFYSGIKEVLQTFSGQAKIYLATSKPLFFAAPLLDRHQLTPLFSGVHGSELDGTRSDKSELINYICEQHRLDRRQTVMIGDRKYDMIGAKNNQLKAIGVLWGFGDEAELFAAGSDLVVEHPRDLLKRIEILE